MTCDDFTDLALCGRPYSELTRAERSAMIQHVAQCSECLQMTIAGFLDSLADDPAEAIQNVRGGLLASRADRQAQDPEIETTIYPP